MDPPRRQYVPDLVYHYQMGLASDSPPLQYLSFYHVAEHYFESVYVDDMVKAVVDTLTLPGFSYRRRADALQLIKTIKQKVRAVGDRDVYNEEESLRLVLRKYVDFTKIHALLDAYDATLVPYYKVNTVAFSDAPVVDFSESDIDRLAKRVAARVYKTRNAIVHSKDGSRGKYVPFHHERDLLKEVPLLRFLAEEIITSSAKAM
jgi:hypothetical protein